MPSEQDSNTDKQGSCDAPTADTSPVQPKPGEPPVLDVVVSVVKEETKESHIYEKISQEDASIPSISSEESLVERIRKTDRRMIFLTSVIAGTGILGWLVTCQQLDAMKDSNSINRAALVADQRAFVFPKVTTHTDIYATDIKKHFWSFVVTWENAGSTPTKDLTININSKAFDRPPDGAVFADAQAINFDTPVSIGPHATISSDAVQWSADQLIAFRNEKKDLYLWGRARYRDIFDDAKIHRTRFVYRIEWLGDPQHPSKAYPVVFSYPLHHKFNCADEECDRHEQEEAANRQPAQ